MNKYDQWKLSEPPEYYSPLRCAYDNSIIEPHIDEAYLLNNEDLVKIDNLDKYIQKYIIEAIVTVDKYGEIKTYHKVSDYE